MKRLTRPGLSLVELLIAVLLLGILAGMVLPTFDPALQDQLRAAAGVLVADLDYARHLAVTNNSEYRVEFDRAGNRYRLSHAGTNTSLDVLPPSPLGESGDVPTEQTTSMASLPALQNVALVAVQSPGPPPRELSEIVFGPLGETRHADTTEVWLAAGKDDSRRYLPVRIDPATGLATPGELQSQSPAGSNQ